MAELQYKVMELESYAEESNASLEELRRQSSMGGAGSKEVLLRLEEKEINIFKYTNSIY